LQSTIKQTPSTQVSMQTNQQTAKTSSSPATI